MAPDTQSIDCNRTFLTLGLALSRPFENSIDDPEYADSEALGAAIKRGGLDDDDVDDEDVDDFLEARRQWQIAAATESRADLPE